MRRAMILGSVGVLVFGAAALALAAGQKAQTHHKIGGETVSVDAAARSITLKATLKSGGTKDFTFTLGEKAQVIVHGKAGTLDEIKAGDPVTVTYVKKEGGSIAEKVVVAMPMKKS